MIKMKKTQKYEYIREQAYILACSGNCMNYLSIESELNSIGLSEARTILDDRYLRNELDNICKKAQSQSEIENRRLFEKWVVDFVEKNIPSIKEKQPQINFYKRNNSFILSTTKKELIITKCFGSRKLLGDFVFEESDGHKYKSKDSYKSKIDFDEFNVENLFEITKKVI